MVLILYFSYLTLSDRLKYKHILPFEAIKRQLGIFPYKQIGAYKQKYKHIFAPKIFPTEDE
jgi:hypothetical protein